MEKKNGFGKKVEAFFAGKGFYIVLFLCVAVIGVSAWAMLAGIETDVDDGSASQINDSLARATETPATEPVPTQAVIQPETEAEPDDASDAGIVEGDTASEPQDSADADVSADTAGDDVAVWAEAPLDTTVASDSFIWPINGEIETPYSVEALLYNRTMADWRTHNGVDIAAELGVQVMASNNGTVHSIYTDDMYGVTVVIDHGAGVKTIYSNLAETPTVNVGDSVYAGDIIGAVGSTALAEVGEVTHLHFAIEVDGVSVDPAGYLPNR